MHPTSCISSVMAGLLTLLIPSMVSGVELTPKEQLGKLLFNDTNLSNPTGQSCASCHHPVAGFADASKMHPVSDGAANKRVGKRNAPTVAYCSQGPAFHYDAFSGEYVGGLFWDGRASNLLEQVEGPLLGRLEMNNPNGKHVVLSVLKSSYANMFRQVYGSRSLDDAQTAFGLIADAIVAYENSKELNAFTSKFDQYLDGKVQLNRREALGLSVFEGKGGCSGCHPSAVGPDGSPPLFTDHTYENVGMPANPENPFYHMPRSYNKAGAAWVDLGLGGVLDLSEHNGKMKVPTLRNVALTAPYGHNGSFQTLPEMVAFAANRNVGDFPPPEVTENVNVTDFGNAGLTDEEIDAVVAFLGTLTDGYVVYPRKDPGTPRMAPVPPPAADVVMTISPNPFNPVTRIEYTLREYATVRMAVYDVAGRLVRSLVDEGQSPGIHAATWDGRDARGSSLASGIYFVRLEAGHQTLVRKAVLTR